MKYLMAFCLFLSTTTLAFSQSYNTAIGVRLGSGAGISLQQRVANKTTLEGIVGTKFKDNAYKVTLVAKQHFPILFKRFNVYTGGGVHKGWYTGGNRTTIDEPANPIENPFGVTLVGGAELSLGKFNISYDFLPSFNFRGGEKAFESSTAVTVRYILWERPTQREIRKKKRKKKKKGSKSSGGGLFDIFKKN